MRNLKLKVELIPQSAFYINLRTILSTKDWDKIRKQTYYDANYQCEICGSRGKILHAHEVWSFDKITTTQRLLRVMAVCYKCHEVIHFGHTESTGHAHRAIGHFIKVNNCKLTDFYDHHDQASQIWLELSRCPKWNLDISVITNQGYIPKNTKFVTIVKPNPSTERLATGCKKVTTKSDKKKKRSKLKKAMRKLGVYW